MCALPGFSFTTGRSHSLYPKRLIPSRIQSFNDSFSRYLNDWVIMQQFKYNNNQIQ